MFLAWWKAEIGAKLEVSVLFEDEAGEYMA
jgi:hypothetical protein